MTQVCAPHDDARPLVLVIDDSKDVHRLLKARLKNEDLDLIGAEDGEHGLMLARQKSPTIILLDLDMPGMDGFEVLRSLKEARETLEIPVIVLSGLQSPQDKVTAFDLGAADYVTKPFDLAELRVRLRAALRVHQLLRMLAQRAQIDGLTGLWNRADFDTRWSEEYSRSERSPRALAVAMIDVDHFKSINDAFGHPAGDAVLQGLARFLRRELRASDVACRYGGEEFVVLMPDAGAEEARSICERLRAGIESLVWPAHPERRVTVSMGIAGCDATPRISAADWLQTADANLYAAKRGGRNRVIASDIGRSSVPVRLVG